MSEAAPGLRGRFELAKILELDSAIVLIFGCIFSQNNLSDYYLPPLAPAPKQPWLGALSFEPSTLIQRAQNKTAAAPRAYCRRSEIPLPFGD